MRGINERFSDPRYIYICEKESSTWVAKWVMYTW